MKFRSLLAAALMGLAGVAIASADSPVGSSGPLHPAAFPKGHYAALDRLPDWGGVWFANFNIPKPGVKPSRPQLKGEYLKEYQRWEQQVKATHGNVAHPESYCLAPGMPEMMGVPQYPIEFLFTPGRVTVHFEAWMQWRNIYTDGRKHPDFRDLDPTFYGNSIGHWEGDTLVVDTVGFKTITQMSMGMNHSDQMHIIERIHLKKGDPNTLVDEMTVEDPLALVKPWHVTDTYRRSRTQQLLEFECEENNRNPVNARGQVQFN
jgi:hypothetical protein